MYYFESRMQFRLEKTIFLSILIHILALTLYHLSQQMTWVTQRPKPIKVKFLKIPKTPPQNKGTLLDAPKPEKIEKPKTSKLLAKHDSRAHGNLGKKPTNTYRGSKLMVPKSRGQRLTTKKSLTPRKKKTTFKPKAKIPEKNPLLPPAEKGLQIGINPQIDTTLPVEKNRPLPDSVFALLDGFDAKPYVSMDTGSSEDTDDSEVISLDTKETLYADYFARIKHQIERVWGYPEAAARNGISGQLTLKFLISKDGNLLRVAITQASGAGILDTAAIKAVKMAAPYYPFPDTIKRQKLAILATFIYSPSYSRTYQAPSYR